MTTLEIIANRLKFIMDWIQAVEEKSKKTDAFALLDPIENDYLIRVYKAGETESKHIAISALAGAAQNEITISGLTFNIRKNPDNNIVANKLVLEPNDIIKGFISNGKMFEAQYLGGDTTDFENTNIYNKFAGVTLQVI